MKQLVVFAFAAIVSACVPAAGYQGGYAQPSYSASSASYAYGTGVFINGQQLSADQKAELDTLLGESVPAGRYTLDARYNFGYEGQPPAINLAAYVRARQGGTHASPHEPAARENDNSFSMYSTDSAGQGSSLVSDGNGCMIMSTPSGSLSSGC
jgi:hypothetical protein